MGFLVRRINLLNHQHDRKAYRYHPFFASHLINSGIVYDRREWIYGLPLTYASAGAPYDILEFSPYGNRLKFGKLYSK